MENPMDPNDLPPSKSRFRHIFGTVLTWIGAIIGIVKPRLGSWIEACGKIFSINNFSSEDSSLKTPTASNTTSDQVMFFIVLSVGIIAMFVSGIIEYKVMTEVYNPVTDIPEQIINFGKEALNGNQDPTDSTTEQEGAPRKPKGWLLLLLPPLTVVAFEGTKCFLTFYEHSRIGIPEHARTFGQKLKRFLGGVSRRLLRLLLILISLSCTLIFFSQLMNKPNEDKVNREIEEATGEIEKKKEEEDKALLELKEQEKVLVERIAERSKQQDKEIDDGRSGRDSGRGRVAKGIREQINYERLELKEVRGNITNRRTALDKVAKQKITEKSEQIRKGGIAQDPKWMSAFLSAVHEGFYPDKGGNYNRRWAVNFLGVFSLMISLSLELIIIEAFKRFGKEVALSKLQGSSNLDSSQSVLPSEIRATL